MPFIPVVATQGKTYLCMPCPVAAHHSLKSLSATVMALYELHTDTTPWTVDFDAFHECLDSASLTVDRRLAVLIDATCPAPLMTRLHDAITPGQGLVIVSAKQVAATHGQAAPMHLAAHAEVTRMAALMERETFFIRYAMGVKQLQPRTSVRIAYKEQKEIAALFAVNMRPTGPCAQHIYRAAMRIAAISPRTSHPAAMGGPAQRFMDSIATPAHRHAAKMEPHQQSSHQQSSHQPSSLLQMLKAMRKPTDTAREEAAKPTAAAAKLEAMLTEPLLRLEPLKQEPQANQEPQAPQAQPSRKRARTQAEPAAAQPFTLAELVVPQRKAAKKAGPKITTQVLVFKLWR